MLGKQLKSLNKKPDKRQFQSFKVSPSSNMIPHSLHNKEYFWSYDEKYDIFSYYFLFFSSFNRKYLKLKKKNGFWILNLQFIDKQTFSVCNMVVCISIFSLQTFKNFFCFVLRWNWFKNLNITFFHIFRDGRKWYDYFLNKWKRSQTYSHAWLSFISWKYGWDKIKNVI